MSTYTNNLNLIKPSYDDDIDVQDLNNNMDVLDTQVNAIKEVNDTQDTRLTALENKTYPYLPLTGGTVTGDLNVTGKYNYNGEEITPIFTKQFRKTEEFDLTSTAGMSEIIAGQYSVQVFQDPRTMWTEMFVFALNSSGDKWFKMKSPVNWANRHSTFIACGLGKIDSYNTYYDNTCTWIDTNHFYLYIRGTLYAMYHFAGYASNIIEDINTFNISVDDETEKMTVKTNTIQEMKSIQDTLSSMNAVAMCSTDDSDEYAVLVGNELKTYTSDEINTLQSELVSRYTALIGKLKEVE